MVVLLDAGAGNRYFGAFDQPGGAEDGGELGTYTWDPVSHELIVTVGGAINGGNLVTLSPTALSLLIVEENAEAFSLNRVIDPATIPVIASSSLSMTGIVGQSLSHAITATNATLSVRQACPTGLHQREHRRDKRDGDGGRTIHRDGYSDQPDRCLSIDTLTLTIAIPTPVGQNVVVEPVVPEGQGPVGDRLPSRCTCAQLLEHVAPLHLLTTMVVPLLSPSGSWFF
jgi:hypothetical protein